ncbi:MAG: hypothetical protein ACI81R_002978, partial [Bradymonadia bacterium]
HRDEVVSYLADFCPCDAGLALRATPPPDRDQAAQARVPTLIGSDEHDLCSIFYSDCAADDELDAELYGTCMGSHDAIDAIAVHQREAVKPESMRLLDELFRMTRAF